MRIIILGKKLLELFSAAADGYVIYVMHACRQIGRYIGR